MVVEKQFQGILLVQHNGNELQWHVSHSGEPASLLLKDKQKGLANKGQIYQNAKVTVLIEYDEASEIKPLVAK